MVEKLKGFATTYYTENGTIKNPDISNRRRIYLDTILIYIHPTVRRVLKMVFIALILSIIFGSIGQLLRAESITSNPQIGTVSLVFAIY